MSKELLNSKTEENCSAVVGDFLFSSYHVALLFSAGIGTGEANNHITSERHIHFGSIEHG